MTLPPGVPPLRELYVYVTDACNCRCRHCWIVPFGTAAPFRHLDPGLLDRAVAEALPLGLARIKWTGGEPTIHPRFEEFLEVQRRRGLPGRLETNGLEVTPRLAAKLVECGVTTVSVSLDGARASTHDAVRGVPGAFRRAVAGLASLREAGFRPQLILSLMRANLAELDAFLELAGQLGAGSVKLNVVQPTLGGKDLHESGEALSVPEVLGVGTLLQGGLAARFPFPVFLDVPLAFRPLPSLLDGGIGDVCGILGILGLLADGSWALCGIGTREEGLVFGKAGEDPLPGVWAGHPVLKGLREGLPAGLGGVCGECLLAGACLGSCVAQNFYRTGRLLAPFWFCEEARRLGLFPSTRLKSTGAPGPSRPRAPLQE